MRFRKDPETPQKKEQPAGSPVDTFIKEVTRNDPEVAKAAKRMAGVLEEAHKEHVQETPLAMPSQPANGKAKKHFFSNGKKKKVAPPPVKYKQVTNTTVNIHASKLMPKDERLNFNDPKAVELPIKIVPRLKTILEFMSSSVQKPPRPLLKYAVVAVIASIAVVIVYNQVIAKSLDADRKYVLQYQAQCIAAGGTPDQCATVPTPAGGGGGGGGGGLFQFNGLINPFDPPGSGN